MNEMITSVGKEILGKDKAQYEKVIENQFQIMIDFFGEQFNSFVEFSREFTQDELDKIDLDSIAKVIYFDALKIDLPKIGQRANFNEATKFNLETNRRISKQIESKLSGIHSELVIVKFSFRQLNRVLHEKVLPFVKNDRDEALIIDELKNEIREKLIGLPF